jgi:Protein phosphatase 2C
MNGSAWRWISASVVGTSHIGLGSECQDSHRCNEIQTTKGPVLLAYASDGAGSAAKSALGSRMLCEVLTDKALEYFQEDGEVELLNPRVIGSWIQFFRDEVVLQASADGFSEREYACTLLGAIVSTKAAALFQLGDGAIVYSTLAGVDHSLAFWPQRGEYENTTYFATQTSFLDQLQFNLIQEPITDVALLSDGLQRLALNYQSRTAHQPFFSGLFAPLRNAGSLGLSSLNRDLETFLNSGRVNERTDDDKTIILATSNSSVPARLELEEQL